MSTSRIHWKGIVETIADAASCVPDAADVVLVRRGGFNRMLVFRCPCGCGDHFPINLDERTGPAWRLYRADEMMSLYPSVWRDVGCESHFIVSHGELWLLRPGFLREADVVEPLVAAVSSCLSRSPSSFVALADQVGGEPWDVLDACRVLVRRGRAEEPERGKFALRVRAQTSDD